MKICPAGYYSSTSSNYNDLGSFTEFWSSTETDDSNANSLYVYKNTAFVHYDNKKGGRSVRCIKD